WHSGWAAATSPGTSSTAGCAARRRLRSTSATSEPLRREREDHVAYPGALEPYPRELVEAVPARDRCGARRARIVHQHLVALPAGEGEQVPRGLGHRGAGQLSAGVANRGDDRQGAPQGPRRGGPGGEPAEVSGP